VRARRGTPLGHNVYRQDAAITKRSYHCRMAMVLQRSEVVTAAKLFRGFSDPTRLAILLALMDGELRVKDLMERIGGSQGNVSKHVACLKDCGLIVDRPEGRQVFYRSAHPEIVELLAAAEVLLVATGERINLCAHYEADDPA
jgi:DNA-binding transcriptional ArsR family regulator